MPTNPPPHLLIEALAMGNDSGLGRVTRMIVRALAQKLAQTPVTIITRRGHTIALPSTWHEIQTRAKPFRFWVHALFPWLLFRIKAPKVLCLGLTIPPLRPRGHFYLLVPDIGPVEDLDFQTSKFDKYNSQLLRKMVKRSNSIITISKFSQQRIIKKLHYPQHSVQYFHPILTVPPVEDKTINANPISPDISSIISNPYILTVGNIEPRKNHKTLIKAYKILTDKKPETPPLIITGHKAWGYPDVIQFTRSLNLEASVIFLDHVSEGDLKALYKNCTIYVSPAIYEGWGLPLYEALSYGKPCLYHFNSSQREFALDIALGIDCTKVEVMIGAMEELLFNPRTHDNLKKVWEEKWPAIAGYDLPERLMQLLDTPQQSPER